MANDRRDTEHKEASISTDPIALAEAEARNGLLQYDRGVQIIMDAIERRQFRLRPSTLLDLHREALRGISNTAGSFRSGEVRISGSLHEPAPPHLVPHLVEEMCDYVNESWEARSALHLSAYVMWRLNWIHPFTDGNGRTSRMLSYVVLSVKIWSILPGNPQIPGQITLNRGPYFEALEAAGKEWVERQKVDVSKMETLLEGLLAKQLLAVHSIASRSDER